MRSLLLSGKPCRAGIQVALQTTPADRGYYRGYLCIPDISVSCPFNCLQAPIESSPGHHGVSGLFRKSGNQARAPHIAGFSAPARAQLFKRAQPRPPSSGLRTTRRYSAPLRRHSPCGTHVRTCPAPATAGYAPAPWRDPPSSDSRECRALR